MSPGSRPKRNGSFPPTSSTAPAAANTKPRTRSSLPISRIGSIASDNSNHYWVIRQTRKQDQADTERHRPWTRQNARRLRGAVPDLADGSLGQRQSKPSTP